MAKDSIEPGGGVGVSPAPRQSSSKFATAFKNYSLFVLLSVIWGMAFVAIRSLDFQLSPVNLAILRWLFSSLGYLVVLAFIGKPKVTFQKSDLPRLLLISFANVPAYHLALNYGETSVSSGLAGLLISLGPVFMVVFSVFMLKEKMTGRLIAALLVAVLGVVILSIGSFSATGSIVGPLEVVAAALAYAVFSAFGKPLVQKYGARHIAIWAGVIGTAMLLPLLSSSFFVQVSHLSMDGWASVLYLSLISSVLGYSLYYTLLSRGRLSRFSIQLYLIPIVSVIGGIILLNESVTIFTLVGGSLMLVAVGVSTIAKN